MKLPNNLKPAQIDTLEKRLAALAARGAQLPKGPMPAGRQDAQRPAHDSPPLTRRARIVGAS